MSEKREKTQSPSQPDAVGAKINVFPPQDRVPESPYMDPATGRLIPIEEGDWRRGTAVQGGPSASMSAADAERTATGGRGSLDPNELDFSIERKESRLPPQE